MTSTPSVKLVLRSMDGLDDISVRTILVKPNTPVPIGRSSKNPDKGLMAASDNALIDSPVISREHASFTTSAEMDFPNICITDEKSRQGTYLNGYEIKRGTLQRLVQGDTLCFGQNVVRDTDSFKAQKYEVGYRLATPEPDRAFASGISVPEVISDDEDADVEDTLRSSSYPARYGSMSNPVNVDDFEDEAPRPQPLQQLGQQPPQFTFGEEEDEDEDDDDDDQDFEAYEPPPPAPLVEVEMPAVALPPTSPPVLASNIDTVSVDAESSDDGMDEEEDGEEEDEDDDEEEEEEEDGEEEETELDYPDEDDNGFDVASSDELEYGSDGGESMNDTNEGFNLPPVESYDDLRNKGVGPFRPYKPKVETLINHDLPKAPTPPAANIAPALGPSQYPPTALFSSPYPQDVFNAVQATSSGIDKPKDAQSPKPFSDPYTHSWDAIGASVPRPQGPKTCSWTMDYNQPTMMRGQSGWSDESYPSFLPSNLYNRSNITGYPGTSFYETKAASDFTFGSDSLEFNHARPSTPPVQPLDTRSEGTSTQPATRTKVSIAEIVDDVLQQPLTPTSLDTSPSRKRKADVLEADEQADTTSAQEVDNKVKESTTSPAASVEQPKVEPPRKKARSTFSLVASAMAAGFVLGGTVVISALASIDITQ